MEDIRVAECIKECGNDTMKSRLVGPSVYHESGAQTEPGVIEGEDEKNHQLWRISTV